ncbi:cysteine sulfinate desulfinase [Steroidobacter denitrificans]|uniref:Cysteine desulfurase n=1 Tax=Steroidobacter denitrificans TaxID=465721 RepID=A0A127FDC4_STEDE|nr:cysteine desulfurase [Steroidobacter denitrificans]AMN47615.1 cysteine sulfinate desulfinase [Steroidobacter denitrificans]
MSAVPPFSSQFADRSATPAFDVAALRRDFPILDQNIGGKPLVYLDNAASSQRPRAVIKAISDYYEHDHANVHRGVHALSQRATDAYEGARDTVRRFINARDVKEIIFVRGTTEAINLVAQSYARPALKPGDEILISALEHHANIVPWQFACEQTGANLKVIPIDPSGEVDFAAFEKLIGPRTRLLALAHVSNALGTAVPVEQFIAVAKRHGVPVLLDGAQAIAHAPVDVQALDCDFYCFSAHKMLGPTGVGVLYGRQQLLDAMPPWQGGGDMILTVSFEKATFNQLPWKFEAGTPNISGVIGLGAAIDYLQGIGMQAIAAYEQQLLEYASTQLQTLPGLRIIGTAAHKAAVVSFELDGIHPHDIGTILDTEGVAIRTGHHCAMPVMDFFKVPATARASMAFYNTFEEIDRLVAALKHARTLLG